MTESWNDVPEVTTAVLQHKILRQGIFTGHPLYHATMVLVAGSVDRLGNSEEEDEFIIDKCITIAKQAVDKLDEEINGQS